MWPVLKITFRLLSSKNCRFLQTLCYTDMDFIFIYPLPFEIRYSKMRSAILRSQQQEIKEKWSVTFKSTKLTKRIKIHQESWINRVIKIKNSLPFLEIRVWRLHFECHYEFYNHNFSSCGNSFLILHGSILDWSKLIKIEKSLMSFLTLTKTHLNWSMIQNVHVE